MAQFRKGFVEVLPGCEDVEPQQQETFAETVLVNCMDDSKPTFRPASPDATTGPPLRQWSTVLPVLPLNPGTASTAMSPAEFETWATSIEDYALICGWAPPLAAPSGSLQCQRPSALCEVLLLALVVR